MKAKVENPYAEPCLAVTEQPEQAKHQLSPLIEPFPRWGSHKVYDIQIHSARQIMSENIYPNEHQENKHTIKSCPTVMAASTIITLATLLRQCCGSFESTGCSNY